jgi:hypothetical protein
MFIIRWLGLLLLILALLALGWDINHAVQTHQFRLVAAGELWYALSPASLNGAQAGIQRYLLPYLWDPILQTVLTWPAVLVLGVPGLLLYLLARRRRYRYD